MSIIEPSDQFSNAFNGRRRGEFRMIMQCPHCNRCEDRIMTGLTRLSDIPLKCTCQQIQWLNDQFARRNRLKEFSGSDAGCFRLECRKSAIRPPGTSAFCRMGRESESADNRRLSLHADAPDQLCHTSHLLSFEASNRSGTKACGSIPEFPQHPVDNPSRSRIRLALQTI